MEYKTPQNLDSIDNISFIKKKKNSSKEKELKNENDISKINNDNSNVDISLEKTKDVSKFDESMLSNKNKNLNESKNYEPTPNPVIAKNSNLEISNEGKSIIFKNQNCDRDYIELSNQFKDYLKLIFRRSVIFNNSEIIQENKLNEYKEVYLIFDFYCLSHELDLSDVNRILKSLNKAIIDKEKTSLNLIIQNSLIQFFKPIDQEINNLLLKELIISDELYNISGNLSNLFNSVKVEKLVLKKFKFNSKLQLDILFDFILKMECTELELEDFFIELIIQNNEDDERFNILDKYITFFDDMIVVANNVTEIKKLKLRDCPLFYISEETFVGDGENDFIIDIDETSIINPALIPKFKIENEFYDICFDLDSYKYQDIDEIERTDYIDQLTMIFKIITGFRENNNDEGDIEPYNYEMFRKIKFKNFNTTKIEYVTGEKTSCVKEEFWQLSEIEKEKKLKWENFEENLKKYEKKIYPGLKILIFDNCTNFFIQNVMRLMCFQKENENRNNINEANNIKEIKNYDLEKLKFKKCGKENLDLKYILKLNIFSLILFDTPLIVDKYPKEKNIPHLSYFDENNKIGKVENLTLRISCLDFYCKEYRLNSLKTYEIIIELIERIDFNKKLCFEMNALSSIFLFLAYKKYCENEKGYYDPVYFYSNNQINIHNNKINDNNDDDSDDDSDDDNNAVDNMVFIGVEEAKNDYDEKAFIPGHFFFDSIDKRDQLIQNAFKILNIEKKEITLKNFSIKNEIEEFENHKKMYTDFNESNVGIYTSSRELEKTDFGYTVFNIDTDFKKFFSINEIKNINLNNVGFSFYTHPIHKKKNETILNLIGNTFIDEKHKKNPIIYYPNYIFDFKTIEGVFLKNYNFENMADLFKSITKISFICENRDDNNILTVSDDIIDKEKQIVKYFEIVKKIIEKIFKNTNGKCFKIKCKYKNEFKTCFCLLHVFDLIFTKNMVIKVKLNNKQNDEKRLEIQDLSKLEKDIGNYFLKEPGEEKDKEVYSEMNYYYQNEKERYVLNTGKFKINNGQYIVDITVDNYNIDDEESDSK